MSTKVALITGAASGIGKQTAIECLNKEIKVSIVDNNSEHGENILETFKSMYGEDWCIFHKADVTVESELEEAFVRTIAVWGKVNIVINCAGILTEKQWMKVVNINLNGVICGTKLGIKYMSKEAKHEGGVIINISSILGTEVTPAFPEYSASKYGVKGYSLCCASDKTNMDKHGVRINVVCPGKTDTPLIAFSKHDPSIKWDNYQLLMPYHIARGILYLVEDTTRNGVIMAIVDKEKIKIIREAANVVEVIIPENDRI